MKKTFYELGKGRKPNLSYFHPFRYKCFILNTNDSLGNFDSKSNCGIFLGCSETSKAFREYNSRTLVVEEAIHIRFDEHKCDKDLLKQDDFFCRFTTGW